MFQYNLLLMNAICFQCESLTHYEVRKLWKICFWVAGIADLQILEAWKMSVDSRDDSNDDSRFQVGKGALEKTDSGWIVMVMESNRQAFKYDSISDVCRSYLWHFELRWFEIHCLPALTW